VSPRDDMRRYHSLAHDTQYARDESLIADIVSAPDTDGEHAAVEAYRTEIVSELAEALKAENWQATASDREILEHARELVGRLTK
jgi:hypothetical protein